MEDQGEERETEGVGVGGNDEEETIHVRPSSPNPPETASAINTDYVSAPKY